MSLPGGGRVLLPVLLVLAGAGGCGPVNAGTAFAEEMEPFLAGREDVAEHSVAAENSLPFSGSARVVVDLQPSLTRAEVVEETVAILTHRVDDAVGYDLTIRFAATAGDGAEAVAGARFRVPEAARDDDALRDEVDARIERGAALVALGTGETVMQPEAVTSRLVTRADALEVWSDLCADTALLEAVGRLEISTGTVDVEPGELRVDSSRTTAQVEGAPGDSCDHVPDLTEMMTLARELGTVDHYRADAYATGPHDPELSVTFLEPPADVAPLTRRAVELGVDLVVP